MVASGGKHRIDIVALPNPKYRSDGDACSDRSAARTRGTDFRYLYRLSFVFFNLSDLGFQDLNGDNGRLA